MPTAEQLVTDPRYEALSWPEKQEALIKFAELNPSPNAPVAIELQRLRHFSQDGTPQSRELHSQLLEARQGWYRRIARGEDEGVVTADYQREASAATDSYQSNLQLRQKDLELAGRLNELEEKNGVSFGNVALDIADTVNPFSIISRAQGEGSNRDIEFASDKEEERAILAQFSASGYTEDQIAVLKSDARVNSGKGKTPVAIDSIGTLTLNPGWLIRDPDRVAEEIAASDAFDSEKRIKLENLEETRRRLIEETFAQAVFDSQVTYDQDDDGNRSNPVISPMYSIPSFTVQLGSIVKSAFTDNNDLFKRGSARPDDFSFEEKEAAVAAVIEDRDDFLDRAGIGLNHGLIGDLANVVATPLELLGSEAAKRVTGEIKRDSDGEQRLDRLVNISATGEFVELAARVLPQIFLTRKIGGAAGNSAAARGASALQQQRVASRFAIGYGGLQSATFNARDVLDNGGTTGEAFAAGMMGFATTYLVASGFNKIGLGGTEDFRRTLSANAGAAKSQLSQKVAAVATGAVGEGVEEFIDEFINGVITQDHTKATADQLVQNAFMAALVGSTFGGVVASQRPILDNINDQSSNEDLSDAADALAAGLQQEGAERAEIAQRVAELRLKSEQGETIERTDGTVVETGLTEEEVVELEQLEGQLRGEPDEQSRSLDQDPVLPGIDTDDSAPPTAPLESESSEVDSTESDQLPSDSQIEEEVELTESNAPQLPSSPTPSLRLDLDEEQQAQLSSDIPSGLDVDEPFETIKDSVFDTLNNVGDGVLTPEQEAFFDDRIDQATEQTDLIAIENEIIEAALSGSQSLDEDQETSQEDSSSFHLETDEVGSFLENATSFQKKEYIRRFMEGEDSLDLVEELREQDSPELLTDEEILGDITEDQIDSDSTKNGQVILYGGFVGLDPALIGQAARTAFKLFKSFTGFARTMIKALGQKIRPYVGKLFHDLRRNNGTLQEAGEELVPVDQETLPTRESQDPFDEDEAMAQARLDTALENSDPTPVESSRTRIRIPKLLPRSLTDDLAKDTTGTQNTFIPGVGRAVQYISAGITKQIHNDIVGEFFDVPVKSWLFGKESARRRGLAISNQFLDLYDADLQTDSEGNLTGVTPRTDGLSLRPSDVIEDVMENGRDNYEVSDNFLRMTADWKAVLDRVLLDARNEGLSLSFLQNSEGEYDYSKLISNFYFPRGTVTLTETGETGSSGGPGGRPRRSVRSFANARRIETEQEGVNSEKYRYDDGVAKRIENFVADVYGRIEDVRLATHPDIVAASSPSRFETTDEGKRIKVQTLGTGTINLAGNSYNFDNERVRKLESIIEGQKQNPDEPLARVSRVFQGVRALKFTFDFSAAAIQLAYLWGHSPTRAAKTVAISLASTLGKRGYLKSYNQENQSLIAERVSLGSLYSLTATDVDFLNETDSTSSPLRRLTARALSPFSHFHTVVTEIGANEMYAALRYQAIDSETGKLDPKKAEQLVRFADRTAGRESLARNGLRASTRSLLSAVSSAPGMYSAFLNVMADVVSKDSFVRNNALKAHSRFIVGASFLFLGKALAAMMLDDEDTRSTEDKILDALSRLNPTSKKFFTTEVPLGEGRRAVVSEGGFFKGATQLSARIINDFGNSGEHIARFLKSKKSPGLGTALEIMTGEDYFGNEITTLESLADAYAPISINEVSRQYRGPALDAIASLLTATTPWDWRGQSMTSLLAEKPHLSQTIEQIIFNSVGFGAYTESSRAEFNRRIDVLSATNYDGRKYRELTIGEKTELLRGASEDDLVRPRFKTIKSYAQFQIDKLSKNLSDPTARRVMANKGVFTKIASIPSYSVGGDDLKVHIDSEDHKEMYRGFIQDLETLSAREGVEDLTDEEFIKEASLSWENQLRAGGY